MSRPLHIYTLGSVVEKTGASPQTRPRTACRIPPRRLPRVNDLPKKSQSGRRSFRAYFSRRASE